MIIDELTYMEHTGVKGMKWGVKKARPGDFQRRSGGQKAALVGAGVVGWTASGMLINRLLSGAGIYGRTFPRYFLQGYAQGTSAIYAVRATRGFLDRNGSTPVSKLPPLPKKKAA